MRNARQGQLAGAPALPAVARDASPVEVTRSTRADIENSTIPAVSAPPPDASTEVKLAGAPRRRYKGRPGAHLPERRAARGEHVRDTASARLHTLFDAIVIVAVAAVIASYIATPGIWERDIAGQHFTGATWVRVVAAFVLATFPAWLLARFLTSRAPALWTEFVVNLHRLCVDQRRFLPEPPESSEYWERWRANKGTAQASDDNLYRRKYEAAYGRGSSTFDRISTTQIKDTWTPVVIYTVTVAIGWTSILSQHDLYSSLPLSLPHVLAVAFAGAYLFNLQMLVRRFFQYDLKSSAYVTSFVRMATVLVSAAVLFQVFSADGTSGWTEALTLACAFVLGYFPMAAVMYLKNKVSERMQTQVGSLESSYPLSELDGLNLWYETRLLEEGIEDMSELVTANIVDVMLHTRVPVGRLVEWLDQAHLYLHLPARQDSTASRRLSRVRARRENDPRQPDGVVVREVLRRIGVTNATSLLSALEHYNPVEDWALNDASTKRAGAHLSHVTSVAVADVSDLQKWVNEEIARRQPSAGGIRLDAIARVLANDTALTPVINWRQWGAQRQEQLLVGLGDTD